MSYQNANGSTGVLREGKFVAFESQDEADASLGPVQESAPKPTSPFASLSKEAQKSLSEAGITTVAEAKAKGKAELVKLNDIGDATADKILALEE